jgi:DNA replication protein DnaC
MSPSSWQNPPRHRAGHPRCQAAHRVLFATAADWVSTLARAHRAGKLQAELTRLGRYPLLVVTRGLLH